MKKILLIGAGGLLGINFINIYHRKYSICATFFKNEPRQKIADVNYQYLDIRNGSGVSRLVAKINPDIILHSASIGDVDWCQKHRREARQVNVVGTENVARAAAQYGIKIIYFSTNAIYDGKNPPFSEKSKASPINYYGLTKLEGEKRVAQVCPDFMILRLITMYGWHDPKERANPVTWIIDKLSSGQRLKIVDDVFNNHLYVISALNVIDELINNWKIGQYFNIAGKDCISRFELAQKICQIFGLDQNLIEPVVSDYFPEIAPRPKNTCFDTTKMQKYLKNKPWTIMRGLTHLAGSRPF